MNRTWGFLALTLIFPTVGEAHLRNYLDTYGTSTLEKGRTELELWTDSRNPNQGDDFWFHQTELEYGLTNRYTVGLYGVFIDGKGFSSFKVENRYHLPQRPSWPFDSALYLELKDANGSKDADEIEGKLILAKDRGKWNVTANGILELERETQPNGEKEWELEPALALGTCYQGGSRITPGLELFFAENKSRVVPGIYIDLLPEVRLNLGLGVGLEKRADDLQLKSILEIEF